MRTLVDYYYLAQKVLKKLLKTILNRKQIITQINDLIDGLNDLEVE